MVTFVVSLQLEQLLARSDGTCSNTISRPHHQNRVSQVPCEGTHSSFWGVRPWSHFRCWEQYSLFTLPSSKPCSATGPFHSWSFRLLQTCIQGTLLEGQKRLTKEGPSPLLLTRRLLYLRLNITLELGSTRWLLSSINVSLSGEETVEQTLLGQIACTFQEQFRISLSS